jgi:hypothetical protein
MRIEENEPSTLETAFLHSIIDLRTTEPVDTTAFDRSLPPAFLRALQLTNEPFDHTQYTRKRAGNPISTSQTNAFKRSISNSPTAYTTQTKPHNPIGSPPWLSACLFANLSIPHYNVRSRSHAFLASLSNTWVYH